MITDASPVRPPAPRPKSIVQDPNAPSPVVTRRPNRSGTAEPLSDRTTIALIRRTLCSSQLGEKGRDAQVPIEELLPPLTSRNDVDLQLYAFLAIVLREFVQSWYNKITTDENFVVEILHIIAHCSRALEQRFREVDLESLVLDEIPDLLDKHITGWSSCLDVYVLKHSHCLIVYSLPYGQLPHRTASHCSKLPRSLSRSLSSPTSGTRPSTG